MIVLIEIDANEKTTKFAKQNSTFSKHFLKITEVLVSSVNMCSQPNESNTDSPNAENKTMMKKDEIPNIGSPIIESCLDPENEIQMEYPA